MVAVSLVESDRNEKLKKHLCISGEDEYQCSSEALNDFVLWSVVSAMPAYNTPKRRTLKRGYVADLVREGGVSPCCVILGLIYIQRLSNTNPHYLATLSPRQLFLIAMVVASKYLNDEGEMEALTNSEWASIGATPKATLDLLEQSFLKAIDWRLYVPMDEFYSFVSSVEGRVAMQQAVCRGWLSYTDLTAIWNSSDTHTSMLQYSTKVAFTGVTLYLVCVSTLLAAAHSLLQLYSENATPSVPLLSPSSPSSCGLSLDTNSSQGGWSIATPDLSRGPPSVCNPRLLLSDPSPPIDPSVTRWLLQPDPGPPDLNIDWPNNTTLCIQPTNITLVSPPNRTYRPLDFFSRTKITWTSSSSKNLQFLPYSDTSEDHTHSTHDHTQNTHDHKSLITIAMDDHHVYWARRGQSPALVCNHERGVITGATVRLPQAMELGYTHGGTFHWDPLVNASFGSGNYSNTVSGTLTLLVQYFTS